MPANVTRTFLPQPPNSPRTDNASSVVPIPLAGYFHCTQLSIPTLLPAPARFLFFKAIIIQVTSVAEQYKQSPILILHLDHSKAHLACPGACVATELQDFQILS